MRLILPQECGLSGGVVESHGAAVVGGQWSALWVDGDWWDQPGVAVEAENDVPSVVVDLGVAALAEEASVVEGGVSVVGPVLEVMYLGM